jgi:FtsH-binding integral membrane protein
MQTNTNAYGGQEYDLGLRNHMGKTYGILAAGLVVSALTAWFIGFTSLRGLVVDPDGTLTTLGHIGMWSPLALLLMSSFRFFGNSGSSARLVYWAFVALQGIGLSLVAVTVPASTIVQALAITACTFGSMSLYGYTTKRALSRWGNFLLMGLLGIIIAAIVNLFLGSSALHFAISVIGIIVFSAFTAYDTQNLRRSYEMGLTEDELVHTRYWSALGLYLNILNIFNFIVSLGRS